MHLAQHTSKKKPITVEIFQSLVSMFENEEAGLAYIHTLSICLLSFVGFLWYDKIVNLKESDILIFEEHLEESSRLINIEMVHGWSLLVRIQIHVLCTCWKGM